MFKERWGIDLVVPRHAMRCCKIYMGLVVLPNRWRRLVDIQHAELGGAAIQIDIIARCTRVGHYWCYSFRKEVDRIGRSEG